VRHAGREPEQEEADHEADDQDEPPDEAQHGMITGSRRNVLTDQRRSGHGDAVTPRVNGDGWLLPRRERNARPTGPQRGDQH